MGYSLLTRTSIHHWSAKGQALSAAGLRRPGFPIRRHHVRRERTAAERVIAAGYGRTFSASRCQGNPRLPYFHKKYAWRVWPICHALRLCIICRERFFLARPFADGEYDTFRRAMDRVAPKYDRTMLLPFPDDSISQAVGLARPSSQ